MPKKPLHPVAAQLLGLGMKALDAGLRAAADTLLEAGEDVAVEATQRVKRGRARLKNEATVEGEGKSKRKRRGEDEEE